MSVAFLLEVAMLAAFCYSGFRLGSPAGFVVGIGVPVVVIVFWGLFMAPRAARRIPWPALPLIALLIFLASAAALLAAGLPVLALLLALVSVGYTVLSFYLNRRSGPADSLRVPGWNGPTARR
jgi:uncharacterized protein DUF2568